MISYHNFIKLMHELFLEPIGIISICADPHWTIDFTNARIGQESDNHSVVNGPCIWWHEEPFDHEVFYNLYNKYRKVDYYDPRELHISIQDVALNITDYPIDVHGKIFANSEKSDSKKEALKNSNFFDWYFFFHGFAALDWFRDYKYLNTSKEKISKVFICLNHIITKKRSYRLHLLSQIYSKNLQNYGYISAPLLNQNNLTQELFDKHSRLSIKAKNHIFKNLLPVATPIILDQCDYNHASANIIETKFSCDSLWHIVTETVFYEKKLHLTEKIFKPIVLKKPFILVSSYGNLQYIKSYGFKTFSNWIDESYDEMVDNDTRVEKIATEIEKLCQLSNDQLEQMHLDMNEILEYNYKHFFGKFREIIVDELIDNFKKCIFLYNKDRSERFQLPAKRLDYDKIKKILLA